MFESGIKKIQYLNNFTVIHLEFETKVGKWKEKNRISPTFFKFENERNNFQIPSIGFVIDLQHLLDVYSEITILMVCPYSIKRLEYSWIRPGPWQPYPVNKQWLSDGNDIVQRVHHNCKLHRRLTGLEWFLDGIYIANHCLKLSFLGCSLYLLSNIFRLSKWKVWTDQHI